MRAYFVTQWFPPEHTPIGYMIRELAEETARNGWDVTVITGFPNHPQGAVFKGYRKALFQEEMIGNIRVWRVFLATSNKRSKLNRLLTFATFTLFSSLALLIRGKSGVIFAVLQPLSIGLLLPLVAKIQGSSLVFNVQDLHPDVPIQLGLIRNPLLIAILKRIEEFAYRSADGLAVICESFKAHCIDCGAAPKNIAVIENWIDVDEVRPSSRCNSFRTQTGCAENDFVVLYAGTIGLVSGAQVVIAAAEILSDLEKIKFVFVGEGSLVVELKALAQTKNLGNVIFAPFQSREMLSQVQAIADISLVTLRIGAGEHSVPSKVLGYMAAGRAVIASVDEASETGLLIKQAACGVVIPPEDAAALAQTVRQMVDRDEERKTMGHSGRRYVENVFSRVAVTKRYISFFNSLNKNTK